MYTMSTFLSRICSTGFLVLVLSACGGGGGGSGGGGGGNPTAQTQSTSITVIDGYIHGATVCVDKNSNGSCEPGETQGTTGPDGKVVLAIPLSDLGKFPIIAYVPAGAIDSDTGKAVGQTFTLKAPKDEHNVVTPLTTMVVHVLENDTSGTLTTTEAKAQVAQSTQIDPKVLMSDVSVIEDLSPRTLARTMAAVQKNRLSDLEAVSSCQATPAEKNKVIQAALNNAWSSIQTEIAKITECKNAKDQKTDACATAIDNAASVAIAATPGFRTQSLLQSLSSDSCSADLLPTASVNSSGRTDNLRPILNGTYSATLGNNYSIRVVNGNTDLGAATLNNNIKTWTFTPSSNLSYGSNSLSAVVVRNSDNLHGKASSVYNLKLGNSVSVSGNTSAGEEFTLTLNNLWDSVKSVVYTFAGAGSDMADGVVSQTAMPTTATPSASKPL
jgi:hypothetical protein